MNKKTHKIRHKELHKNLDELVADFIKHTENLPSRTTLMEFMEWSYEQTINPTEEKVLKLEEIGNGIKDFASFMFRMGLYKEFLKRCKDKKIHFVALEMDENQLRDRLYDQYLKMNLEVRKRDKERRIKK